MLFSDWEKWFAWCFDLLEVQWQIASLRAQKAETKLETDDKQDAWFYSNCTAFPLSVGCSIKQSLSNWCDKHTSTND